MHVFKKITTKFENKAAYSYVNLRRAIASIVNQLPKDGQVFLLRKNGLIQSELSQFSGISDFIRPKLCEFFLAGQSADINLTVLSRNQYGIKTLAVDLNSAWLFRYIFTWDFYELLKQYYGTLPLLRNMPTIEINYPGEINDAQKYHVDWGLQQLSLMVNLEDVTESSTYMEYLRGSNRRYLFGQPHRDSLREKRKVNQYLKKNPDSAVTTQGKMDTAFLFDAGNGFHRQIPGGARVMLHMNFVENLAFTYWDRLWKPEQGSEAYWFSEANEALIQQIKASGIPLSFFGLVLRDMEHKFGVPDVYRRTKI